QPNQSPLIINTGGNATINDSSTQNSTTAVNNQNTANVGQTVNASANTGGNTANGNISFGGNAGNITTGNAVVYNELVAAANSNQTGVSGNCHGAPGGSSVVNTGTDLTYDGSDTANCVTTITNGNGAVINQVVYASANTGDNQANGNIAIGGGSAGVITTGDAAVGTLLVTRANENVVLVGGTNGNGGPGNGANIYLINTGSNASIDNRRLYNSLTTVNNSNAADILQSADIFAN